MRFEFDVEKSLTCVFDNEGELYYEEHSCAAYFDVHQSIISNETLAKLEAIIKETGAEFPIDQELDFCKTFYCFCTFDVFRWLGGKIKNQQALRDLVRAFLEMDCMDQKTFLEAYERAADLRPSKSNQVWTNSRSDPETYAASPSFGASPKSFVQAADNLLIGDRGLGRKSTYDDQLRKRLFHIGYKLFLDLGLEPKISNGGCFGRFMKTILKDPALKHLTHPPDNIKKLIKGAEKSVEREAEKADSRGVLNTPF